LGGRAGNRNPTVLHATAAYDRNGGLLLGSFTGRDGYEGISDSVKSGACT
jgi:hypothetical protein